MKYWYKRHRFGYGWAPASPQGWLSLIIYLFLTILGSIGIINFTSSEILTAFYIALFTFVTTFTFILIISKKSPKPKWRWGKKHDDNPNEDF